jgi:hypothetical protein
MAISHERKAEKAASNHLSDREAPNAFLLKGEALIEKSL